MIGYDDLLWSTDRRHSSALIDHSGLSAAEYEGSLYEWLDFVIFLEQNLTRAFWSQQGKFRSNL